MAKDVPATMPARSMLFIRPVDLVFHKNHSGERFPVKFVIDLTDLILVLNQFSHPSQIQYGSNGHWNSVRQKTHGAFSLGRYLGKLFRIPNGLELI